VVRLEAEQQVANPAFIDDVCFHTLFDGSSKAGVENRKSAEEIAQFIPLKERPGEVLESMQKDKPPEAAGSQPARLGPPAVSLVAVRAVSLVAVASSGGRAWSCRSGLCAATCRLSAWDGDGDGNGLGEQCLAGQDYVACLADVKLMTEPATQPGSREGLAGWRRSVSP
jgi:hypothetical protein